MNTEELINFKITEFHKRIYVYMKQAKYVYMKSMKFLQ